MCAKKKATQYKTWKLAGEPMRCPPLSVAEREWMALDFLIYQPDLDGSFYGVPCASQAEARIHENAARNVAAYLCERYTGRFEREDIIKAVVASRGLSNGKQQEAKLSVGRGTVATGLS